MPGTPVKTYDDYPDAGQFIGNESIPLMQTVTGVRKVRKVASSLLGSYLFGLLPNWSCRAYRNAALSIPSAVWTDIPVDAVDFDGNNLVNLGTGALGPLGSSVWQVSAQLCFALNATGWRGIAFRDVNSTLLARVQVMASSATRGVVLNLTVPLKLAGGGYVWLQGLQDSGAAMNIQVGLGLTWFGMHLYH